MFCYVLDQDNWRETDTLFPHDIAILIDNKIKKAYLWFGNRSDPTLKANAEKKAKELISKYGYELIILVGETVPMKIEAEIETLLGENADISKYKIPRTKTMQWYCYISYAAIILMGVVVGNNFRMLTWDVTSVYYTVDIWTFNDLFELSVIFSLICSILYFVVIILGLINKKIFLTITAVASFSMSLGLMFYLAEGEFIFQFIVGSPTDIYWIRIQEITYHIIWNILMWFGATISIMLSVIAIKRTTEIKPIPKEAVSYTVKPSLIRKPQVNMNTQSEVK